MIAKKDEGRGLVEVLLLLDRLCESLQILGNEDIRLVLAQP